MDTAKLTRSLPLIAIAAPAFVATWSGWVGLGEKAGFGKVRPLPGIANFEINTAITLPLGIEAYAAYALGVWLSNRPMAAGARRFAMLSGLISLVLGALGQVAFHLLEANGQATAPAFVVVCVACLPIAIVGMSAALWHMLHASDERTLKKPSRSARPPAAARETAPAVTTSPAAGAPKPTPDSRPSAENTNVRSITKDLSQREQVWIWFKAQVDAAGGDVNAVTGPDLVKQFGAEHLRKKISDLRRRYENENTTSSKAVND